MILFGGMSDSGIACAFMQSLPDQVKYLLCTLTQMDNLSIDCMQAIMKDEVMEEGSAVAAV